MAESDEYRYTLPGSSTAVYSAGTVMVRLGGSYLEADDQKGKWRFDRVRYPFLDGLRYKISTANTWNFTAGFMPMDHFAVEVGYIGKSTHDLDFQGLQSPFAGRKIRAGDIERRSGTIMFNWFPVCTESWVQPYVGVGFNYTDFDDVKLGRVANEYLAVVSDGIGEAKVFLDDTWGWAAQVGLDVMFGPENDWFFNAAIQYQDVEVTADLHFAVPGVIIPKTFVHAARTRVEFDPWIYSIGFGYKFRL
ncbi:OmpW/AlkL family protein [Microbulbifer donghaiensis]|uniref:OmpW/AlkL family protein n=1 Tax=Microbulbifer donghaiensis TaxID=494016 RepID=UPI0013564D48|nr:OmpW family outer membrane protein [Microbulbifer donghaiensis]